ncbi:MAG: phage major capsid protein, partial [Plesiomonas sp.]
GIDAIGVGKKFMFFGDFDNFIIRRVNYMVLKRLVERFAEFDQTGFLAFHRFDCCLQDAAAIKALTGK